MLADVIDGADIGMVQRRRRVSLAAEPSQRLRFPGFGRQKLKGDEAVQPRVFGFVDYAHAAGTQLLQNTVMRDDLTDQWAEMLGLDIGQVNESVEVVCVSKGELM